MKKVVSVLLALTFVIVLAGCGAQGGVVVDPGAQAANAPGAVQQPQEPGVSPVAQNHTLFFESNGVKIRPYDLAEAVLGSLGKPNSSFEAPSCAYQGVDKFYTYGGFQLTVNEIDGADHVTIITVTDDTVSIPQGVKIGDTQDAMLQKMGNNYQECGGSYEFVEDTTTLSILVQEGKVTQIMYLYNTGSGAAQVCPTTDVN
jgi:predicted small lipoprotein YifL